MNCQFHYFLFLFINPVNLLNSINYVESEGTFELNFMNILVQYAESIGEILGFPWLFDQMNHPYCSAGPKSEGLVEDPDHGLYVTGLDQPQRWCVIFSDK